jgi:hypothetical protein
MPNILTINKPNITDFAKERNVLLNNSKNEWNLFLDNDEIQAKGYEKLNNQLNIKNYEHESYYLTRKNYFLGQYVGTDKIIRLVKKGTGKWVRAVHEVWIPNDNSKVGIIDDTHIIHNTADNLADYINKMNNYSSLHSKENLKEGKKSSLFKIIFFPIQKFIATYIKSKNIVFSIMQSLHSFLSWSKLYFLQH